MILGNMAWIGGTSTVQAIVDDDAIPPLVSLLSAEEYSLQEQASLT